MIITKDAKVSVDIQIARKMLRVAGFFYEETQQATDDEIFKMALSMSDCYGVSFEFLGHLKEEHAALLADMKTLCEDTGDGCHLCKHFPCASKFDHCQGWEWRGKFK